MVIGLAISDEGEFYMTTKAMITRRGGASRNESLAASEGLAAESLGLTVEQQLPHATLVSGEDQQLAALEAQGFRVKLLPETEILEVGSYRIDVNQPPKLPAKLSVPKKLEKTWRHHLVQLSSPPTEEWTHEIEARGVDVVEPISAYGLFVVGDTEEVKKLKELPYVVWVGLFQPAYRIAPNLNGLKGRIEYVNVGVYPESEVPAVKRAVEKLKGKVVDEWAKDGSYRDVYRILIVEIDAKNLTALASEPAVRWLEYQSPKLMLEDERSAQIVAESLNGAAPPNTAPVAGYQAILTGLGVNGAGVVVGICDSGVDTNSNAGLHPDLAGRLSFFVDQTGGMTPTDINGHGTHVAGIAVGNAATGDTDPQGFLLGQGMAPGANFGVLNPVDTAGSPGTGPVATFTQLMVNNGAHVMNNSWRQGGGGGYTAGAALVDQLVRDPNQATANPEYLAIVFSAGNNGSGAGTITPPKEAKNPIVVGNSLNFRPGEGSGDDIRGISSTSSRGPATDSRILPTIVAPGTDIISARPTVDANPGMAGVQRPRTAYTDTGGTVHQNHYPNSGTSMAAPHVTGLCALLIEWWRNRTGGKNPSPALLKALLINGAEDLAGGPNGSGGTLANIPNNNQGWGRVSLENMLLNAPDSDRGPKVFSDQRHAFTANGQEHTVRVAPVDTARPMRITLVWTDSPGAANANPALVNDLDLEVTQTGTANIFKGNVFTNGFSVTGGAFDNRNNIECVYIQNPSGTYDVTVIAAAISANTRPPFGPVNAWQDFALVIDNAEFASASPVSVVPVIDRSGSMVAYGYEAITRISSKQFVDLMNVSDQLGVASFGTTATVEFPTGASPVLQNITGQPVKNAATTRIDGVAFGGSTFMGGGINKGKDLLTPATTSRAMVLLSDGYDNKGFVAANPSALDAVAGLPANMPIYSCAMGPASDQPLLEQIATLTGGRYYFMPAIDDLFEVYNYIRGNVTGDGIIANETAMASSSRVAAFVDSLATEATFTVAWADTKLKFVAGDARKATDVSVRLRDPRGRLLHPNASHIRRIEGKGYVVFKLQEPMPGQWFIEVSTAGDTHVRYTAGGFVRSSLRLVTTLLPRQIVAGMPITVAAQIFEDKKLIKEARPDVRVIAPSLSLAGLQTKFKTQLQAINPLQVPGGDKLPTDIGKVLALRDKLLRDNNPDILATVNTPHTIKDLTVKDLRNIGLGGLLPTTPNLLPTARLGILAGQFKLTQQQGSYNVVVTVNGTAPASGSRYVRKAMASVLVK